MDIHLGPATDLNKIPICGAGLVCRPPPPPDNDRTGLENKALTLLAEYRFIRGTTSQPTEETLEMLICQQFITGDFNWHNSSKEFIGNYDISQRFKLVSPSLAARVPPPLDRNSAACPSPSRAGLTCACLLSCCCRRNKSRV